MWINGKIEQPLKIMYILRFAKADPAYTIHITSNGNLNQRIRTLNDKVKAGQPIRTIGQDFSTIIRDIGRRLFLRLSAKKKN